MNLNISYSLDELKEVDDIVKERLPEIIKEVLLKDENKLRNMIRDAVRGQLRSTITEILQHKDYRNFLKDKIEQEIGIRGDN